MDIGRTPRRSMQGQHPKTMKRDASDMSAAEERRRAMDATQNPQAKMQEQQPKIMTHECSNISATAEAGSRRSPSPLPAPPIGREERRRITRREAKRRRDGIGNIAAVDSNIEVSSAADQRTRIEEGGRKKLGGSAPVPGQDRESSLPFRRPNKNALSPRQMAAAPPILANKPKQIPEPAVHQAQARAQLMVPPDSDSH